MPYEWTIDRASRTVLVRGSGTGTTEDTLELIRSLNGAGLDCSGWDLLYDAVDLRIESSAADMIRVADALFHGGGARFRRCAIVVPPDRVALARMFAALADPYGVRANVFGDIDVARDWLALRKPRPRRPPDPLPFLPLPDA